MQRKLQPARDCGRGLNFFQKKRTKKAEPTKDSAFQNNWRTRHATSLPSDAINRVPTHPHLFIPVLVHILNGAAAGVVNFLPGGIPFKGDCC